MYSTLCFFFFAFLAWYLASGLSESYPIKMVVFFLFLAIFFGFIFLVVFLFLCLYIL